MSEYYYFKHPVSLIAYSVETGEVAGLKMNSILEGNMLPDVLFDEKYKKVMDEEQVKMGKADGELWTEDGEWVPKKEL